MKEGKLSQQMMKFMNIMKGINVEMEVVANDEEICERNWKT